MDNEQLTLTFEQPAAQPLPAAPASASTWCWRGPNRAAAAARYRARFGNEPPSPVERKDSQGVTLVFAVGAGVVRAAG